MYKFIYIIENKKNDKQLSRALTISHLFTSNEFNRAFDKKGKKRIFNKKKQSNYKSAFLDLLSISHSEMKL